MAKANDIINLKYLIEQAGPLVIPASLPKPQWNLHSWDRGFSQNHRMIRVGRDLWRSSLVKEVILLCKWPNSHTSCLYPKTCRQTEAFWKALERSSVAQGSPLHGISLSQGPTTVATNDW